MNAPDGHYSNFRWGPTGEPHAMRIEQGRIVSRASAPLDAQLGFDLGGRFVFPAFVDCHCHILPAGLDLQKLHLGLCSTREEVLDAVRDAERTLAPGKWLMAVHYDQTRFADGKHLTLPELDSVSLDRPIVLRHANGHASVVNRAALLAAGVNDTTPDPEGGSYRRDAEGRMDGVLFEHAHEFVTSRAPAPNLEEMVEAILAIGEKMAALGIATASDMMTGRYDLLQELQAYRIAAERGCKIRTRLYLQWGEVFGPRAVPRADWEPILAGFDPSTCRVGGIKIFADGAIGSATAAIYGGYTGSAPNPAMIVSRSGRAASETGSKHEVSGQLIYSPEKLSAMVRTADEAGYQVSIHSIGDYATDLVMDAYEALPSAKRHRIEHAMLLSDAQIERMARLGCHCVMQPEFLLRFGHAYAKQLGQERAAGIKRFRSVLDAGIPLAFSSDRPIVSGDPRDGIRMATDRPAGFDPAENLTPAEALYAYTRGAALANEDADMGGLEPGQFADFRLSDEGLGR